MKKIHLMAICGMAMGSLAGMLKETGYEVRGSDEHVYPPMSDQLANLGVSYFEGFQASNLDWNPDMVVVGNVTHWEAQWTHLTQKLDPKVHLHVLPSIGC